jgi:hypothetical protein
MRKFSIFVVVIIFFAAVYFIINSDNESTSINSAFSKTISEVKKMIKFSSSHKIESGLEKEQNTFGSSSSSADQTQTQAQDADLMQFTTEELKKWIATEARSMNFTSLDTEAKQIELKAQAQSLQLEQLAVLSEVAIDASQPINDRILSAYLISLNPTSSSLQVLSEVAKSEIPDNGPLVPHSEAELKNSQELAIRYMQIDELFTRAKTDSNAYDKLSRLADEARSAQVRSYAKKKLLEIKK